MKKVSMIMMAVIAAGQLTAQPTKKLSPLPPPVPPPAAVKMHKTPPPPMVKEVNKVQPPPPKPPKIHKEKVHFVAPKIVKDSTN
ncbi:MAG: hypothetical protein ABIU77_00265 [Ferruginibacter sp.]